MENTAENPQPLQSGRRHWLLAATAITLGLAGIISMVYGFAFHREPVLVKEKVEAATPAPASDNPMSVFPDFVPPAPPQPTEKIVTKSIPEMNLVKDVSVGGLTRNDRGEVERTYSGDEGPALCPT
jgi:hypothetical protein